MGYHLNMSDAIEEPDSLETESPRPYSTTRKRFRFSIRFLLLATLVAACVVAWANQRVKECRAEADIVEELQADGIKIEVIPRLPNWFEIVFGQRLSKRAYEVQLGFKDIGAINRLTQLEYVESIDSDIVHQDLYAYSHFKNLKTLYVGQCYALESLGGIEKLQRLEDLTLWDADRLESCKPLASLKNLKRLNINYDDSSKLKDLDEVLPQMSGLQSFETDLFAPDSFECFAGLKNLEELDLHLDFSHATSLDGLDHAPNLKKLSLVYCSKITDLKALNSMSAMTDLSIDTNVESLEFLQHMKNLKSLDVALDVSKVNPSDATSSALAQLENLDISCAGLEAIGPPSQLLNLKHLDIGGEYPPGFEFSTLSEIPSLKELHLHFLRNLQSLDGIESLTLSEIFIGYCPDLTDIQALGKVSSIRKITISNCKKVPVSQISALRSSLPNTVIKAH